MRPASSCYISCGDLSHTRLVLGAMIRKSLYWDTRYYVVVYQSSNWDGICAVPRADAVATGEINCQNFIVQSQGFSEAIGQRYVSAI